MIDERSTDRNSRSYQNEASRDGRDDRRREFRSRGDEGKLYEARAYSGDERSSDRRKYNRPDRSPPKSREYAGKSATTQHGRSRHDAYRDDRSYERDHERRVSRNGLENRDVRRSQSPTEQPNTSGPNFERSGLLARESNNMNGVALKYHEPPEARRPKTSWRMFVFKNGKEIGTLHAYVDMLVIGRQSCYLFGRDRSVVDIPIEHPSCSKQHAVIQFRQVTLRSEFGDERRVIQFVFSLR